jgi:hypothetical protein
MRKRSWKVPILTCLGLFALACTLPARAQTDVTQPGDTIVASSPNSPGSEGAANAIDNQPTKYLNFDAADGTDVGFVVTPSVGLTRVVGMTIQSANDAPERDPRIVALDGSNADAAPAWADDADWERIAEFTVPLFTERFEVQTFFFENLNPYRHYRWVVLEVADIPAANSMQVAEVELLGTAVPPDVTQPGDLITGSSPNSPGSEGVANAIDNQPTKYLNFDAADGTDVGFVVSPSIGRTLVTGMSVQSANDAPERDPRIVALEGSNAETAPAWDDAAAWEPIMEVTFPAFTARFQTQTVLFDNYVPYWHYRWVVREVADIPAANSMQVAEVELHGSSAPKDVTQPGDLIVASSPNSPGSEGAANAIDNQPTKYLNFDAADGTDVGFIVTPSIGESTVIGMTIQSANDAPERDPHVVALDGSNAEVAPAWADDAAWERIVEFTVPLFTERFQVQEFFFPNTQAYQHYRWVVLEVANIPSANSMQVAEVELLAVTAQADCAKARIRQAPEHAYALAGDTATFLTVVNGPWPVQWYRYPGGGDERVLIPGATQTIYTTTPITAANADDEYTVEIVGCPESESARVKAHLFVPSDTKSIGLSWEGGGANGAPTPILPNDVAGIHLQAYWNNLTEPNGTGMAVVDSDNQASTITITFASSGEWGAGTGNITPKQRLLNGLILAANPGGTPGNITFSGVPAGEHSVIAYTMDPPLQFQDQNYTLIGQATRSVFTKQMNADQYNPTPVWVRGTSPDPNIRTLANYVRFDRVVPAADGTVRLEWATATTGFDRGVAINAVQLLLNPPYLGEPPTLVLGPVPTETLAGATVQLTSLATGDNLNYQWSKGGVDLADGGKISGALSPSLTIRSFAAADEGYYTVTVANAAGSVRSDRVRVRIVPETRAITDNLVTYFKFDETSGTTVLNSGSDGAASNGILDDTQGPGGFMAGRIGNAFYNQNLSFIKVPDYTKFTTEGTVSLWVNASPNITTYAQSVQFVRNAEGTLGVASPLEQFEFGLAWDNSALAFRLFATIAAGPNRATATEPVLFPLDSWQHVAFTIDGGQIRLYRNGELAAVSDYFNPINTPDIPWLSIGGRLVGTYPDVNVQFGNEQVLEGMIDDLGIWTFAWPQSVIQSIHQQGLAGQPLTAAELPVLPGVPTEVELAVTVLADGSIQVDWSPAAGTLQSTGNLGDPASWSDVAGNPNPYLIPTPTGTQFLRVLVTP